MTEKRTPAAERQRETGSTDGQGAGALFSLPSGIAVATSGKIYVADALNNDAKSAPVVAPEPEVGAVAGATAAET